MATQVFAMLNPNALGPGLVLDQGNLVVTTNAAALSSARKVLGTVPKGVASGYFECIFYSDTQAASLPSGVLVGIARADSPLTSGVGVDALSYGYEPLTGNIRNNNGTLLTTRASVERSVLGVYYNGTTGYLAWFLENNILGSTIVAAGSYVPAVTVCGGNAADVKAVLYFGQRGLKYPQTTAPV